ncbi:MAG: HAMP domain-containing sensor histidine kinase [Clostridia bacterium]|nr:HAMP domain-containing sensor histidine kinase [Clostridia bacterium]
MVLKGIKRRWIYNSLGFTVAVFGILVIAFFVVVRGYFYSGIEQNIKSRAEELCDIIESCSVDSDEDFVNISRVYIENFKNKDAMQITVFNKNDEAIMSSSGFLPEKSEKRPDYDEAKFSDTKMGIWEGKSLTKEKIMAVTRSVYDHEGNYLGAIRYAVSMEKANARINFVFVALVVISFLVIAVIVISGLYFVRSIVNPVSDICSKAKQIARGDFHVKIGKKYDDEIGELSDTINYMAEELDVTEKLKNEFISSVSHELRTPLTAIKGWAETMQLCEDSPETRRKGLTVIVKEAERLSWIVEGLLDFSSIKEKRIKLIKEKIDILAEIGEAVYMFKDRAENEKKALIYNEPKMLPPVMGDKNRLRQVFINILDNALKYTSEGGAVSVDVKVKDDKISISFTDNGCGIPPEHLSNVTKKFYKANYLQQGSGIGLAIVDEIVSLHGGTLNILSEEGFGTTVTVVLPVFLESEDENESDSDKNADI